MLEILAPAGNLDCAKAAIHNGANAIYLGAQTFSARQSAENFDEQSLKDVIFEAHLFGVKVYVAMNTAVKDGETESFLRTLLSVWALGADAIILQDVLLGKMIHQHYPQIVLHLSTQAGVCSVNGAKYAKSCGFSRVILARETPLGQITKIAQIIETEVFVQGALCTCFSGQCYFSSFAGGNSGNRGRCKQPCRKLYQYDRSGCTEKNYALSLSDLCVGDYVQKYIDAGVCSVKIEGRMRRAEYVAASVQYYRTLLDGGDRGASLSALKRTYNRGNYTAGLAFGQDKRFLSTAVQGHLGEKVGVVKVENGQYLVESVFSPLTGDAFKILRDGKEVGGAAFLKPFRRGFLISSKHRLKNGDGVFITTDTALNNRLLSTRKMKTIELYLHFHENEFAVAEGAGIRVLSDERLQSAQSRPLTEDEIRTCFTKTDGLPIDIAFGCVDVQGACFLPKSMLNAFRRKFFAAFIEHIASNGREAYTYVPFTVLPLSGDNAKTAVISDDFRGIDTDIAVYKPDDYRHDASTNFVAGTFEKYIYYPAFCTDEDELAVLRLVRQSKADGVYIENYAGLAFAKEHGLSVFAGTGLNLFNSIAVGILSAEPSLRYYAISKELNEREQARLVSEKAFVLQTGDIKLMDLCYCPFGKTCNACDKKTVYTLTDENGRLFPVRRFIASDGSCRFEVYNCARLAGYGVNGAGALMDASVDKTLYQEVEQQKINYKNYTFGHASRGVL